MGKGDVSGGGVTVIILTCGEFEGLKRTLDSVTRQTFPMEAVIVSDDGSGKEFPSVLREGVSGISFRANGQNMGTVAHMNKVALGTGSEYIKFLAEGDAFSHPEALKELVSFAGEKGTPVVSSQSVICDSRLTRRLYPFPGKRAKRLKGIGKELFRVLSLSNLISAPGTLFHRSFFIQLGGFDESYRLLEDWPAWLRLARGGYGIPCLDQVTCLHASGGVSSKDLDAHHSSRLRRDMILCYEQEILPYLDRLSPREVRQVRYGYELVCGSTHEELLKKYPWQERKTRWKRGVKGWLLGTERERRQD